MTSTQTPVSAASGAYDALMAEREKDELTERVARTFHAYLCGRYPGITWVRVRREHERLDLVPAVALTGNLRGGLAEPDGVDATGEVVAA